MTMARKPFDAYVDEALDRDPKLGTLLEDSRIENEFGLELMRLRSLRGLSQRELAELSGIKQPMINRLERGAQTPTLPTVLRLMRALGAICEISPNCVVCYRWPLDI